ncbi:hypothetical protein C8R26_103111 [Nitrosomonas oligotropha]|uniref:Uncharacterized protein n=1 Tax=Nitrosomonas oligotropha TaxID=42354 RepID=A0A2T5I3D8_9PROT|nr:hypothetical protein C8R26_103111 [Nitrosomonas oligotropha]
MIDRLGDPLMEIGKHIDFAALLTEVDCMAPRPVNLQGGRPPSSIRKIQGDSILLYHFGGNEFTMNQFECLKLA